MYHTKQPNLFRKTLCYVYNVLFWQCITVMYNNFHILYILKVNGLMFIWIFLQHNFIISGFFPKKIVRYSFIHVTAMILTILYQCYYYELLRVKKNRIFTDIKFQTCNIMVDQAKYTCTCTSYLKRLESCEFYQ